MANIRQIEIDGVLYDLRDDSKIPVSEKGVANGVATLDNNGLVTESSRGIRYGSTEDWSRDLSYIPKRGEVIVYSDRGTVGEGANMKYVPGVKVGDGLAYLVDLPFVGDDQASAIMAVVNMHRNNTDIHVTATEKAFWNNKLNYVMNQENLILNRL